MSVVTTRDPYGFSEKNEIFVKHIRKCIAKSIGVGYSKIVEEKHGSDVCFDESDVNDFFLKRHELQFEN